MKKCYCDDCKEEITTDSQHIVLPIKRLNDYRMDFCVNCVTKRVNHSFEMEDELVEKKG